MKKLQETAVVVSQENKYQDEEASILDGGQAEAVRRSPVEEDLRE